MDVRVPPHNLDAERALIGSILIDNTTYNKVAEVIRAEFFYEPRHKLIFDCIEKLAKDNKAIDVLTLTAELKRRKKFKQAGGTAYISELINIVPTSGNVKHYAELVREMAIRRNFISFGAKLDEFARQEDKELEEIVNELEQNVLSLSRDSTLQDYYDSATLLELQMQKADEYAKNPDGIRGLATGYSNVDNILNGLHNSDLIILAARPSVGKSAFAFNVARHIAVEEKKTILLFSLEMPAVQVMERMLAQQMKAKLWNLRMGRMTESEHKRYPEGAGKLGEAKIFIDETPGVSIVQLRSKARKLMMEQGLDFIVIDYLQLMMTRDIDNRAQAIGEISRSLKILARELNIPIMALSQLNRAIENRADRIPQLSDLRESGSIEQDADLVMFLSRDASFDDEDEEDKEEIPVELTVAKHRNGPIGRCKLNFIGSQQRYEPAD